MRKKWLGLFLFCLLALAIILSAAQLGKLKSKIADQVLRSKPVLTTSLNDATTEVPFLDDYNPSKFYRLRRMPLKSDSIRYYPIPGSWTITLRSYCLNAGKYAPAEGKGYLYAPLKGEWADIIRSVLQRSVVHQEIPQSTVQSLIWGILARTKIADMPSSLKIAAAKLLTPKEIVTINGGALGLIPQALKEEAFRSLPAAVREVLEAEAALRDMLRRGMENYEDLERVAVRAGIAPPQKGDREIPASRWSYHPDGYFVRYLPSGYTRTTLQISIPRPYFLRFDEQDRLISIKDWRGRSLEIQYDDNIMPLTLEKGGQPIACAFRSLKLTKVKAKQQKLTKEWSGKGWTLVSLPDKEDRISRKNQEYYARLNEALKWGHSHRNQVENLLHQAPQTPLRDGISEMTVQLGYFIYAAESFFEVNSKNNGNNGVEKEAIKLLKEAWQHLIRLAMMEHQIASRKTERIAEPYLMLLKGGPSLEFGPSTPYLTLISGQEGRVVGGIDLSGSSAVSGNQGEQPEGMGGPADDFPVIDLSGEEEVSGEEEDFPVIDLSGGDEDDFNNPEYLNAYFYAYSSALLIGWLAAWEGMEYDDSAYHGDFYESLPEAGKRGFEDGWKADYNESYTEGEEFRAKKKKSRGRKPPLSG